MLLIAYLQFYYKMKLHFKELDKSKQYPAKPIILLHFQRLVVLSPQNLTN